nr:PREDICTED: LOW QUALITY PROTEIN: uncharacterized protein LOC105679841 [Linepithema humile]
MRSKSAEREARGMGFKDEQTALNTLEILDGHDILYQYSIITDFIRRAKSTLEDTRDEKKLADLRDGLEIFEDWLADFEENNRMKERLPYLPIGTVNVFYDHAKKYGVWDDEFFEAYKNTDGDYEDLCEMEVPGGGGITWDVERNRRLKEIICKIKNEHISLYEDVRFSNFRQPTKEHTQCIVLAYSPDPHFNISSSSYQHQEFWASFAMELS